MDTLVLKDRIRHSLSLLESQFREFKSAFEGSSGKKSPRNIKAVARDIAETLVSFANSDGGELLVGVEDDGKITGYAYDDTKIQYLLDVPITHIHKDTPLAAPVARIVEIDNKNILYFYVEKSSTTVHQTSDGKCLQRRDRENLPVSFTSVQFERSEQISRTFDRQFVDNAYVSDLEIDIITRISSTTENMSPEKCLQYLGVAEYAPGGLRLRKAALLLFGKDILRWHSRCQVRIVRVPGFELKTGKEYHVISDDISSGNILRLINSAWEKLRPHLVQTRLTQDSLFKEQFVYPEDACREALINAIAHRDYSAEGMSIEIYVYDDRMDFVSPGALLSTVNITDLRSQKGIHESRNALIARVLKEIGYVREMGEGMRRIYRSINEADLVAPELVSTGNTFKITLFCKSVLTDSDQAILSQYAFLKLSREESRIILLGKSGRLISPQEIYDHLHLVDWDIYRMIYETLFIKGIVFNTLTETQKNKISKSKELSKRAIKRLAIRSASEIERAVGELLNAIKNIQPISHFSLSLYLNLLSTLSTKNPLRIIGKRSISILQILEYLNPEYKVTAKLIALWGKAPTSQSSPNANLDDFTNHQKSFQKKSIRDEDTVFIGNLDYNANEDDIRALFSACGKIIKVIIPIDYVTNKPRGFGFVKYENKNDAIKAIFEMNGKVIKKRAIRVTSIT